MKIKRNCLSQYYHRKAIPKKDNEGNSYLEYGIAVPVMAEVWPAGGKIQAEIYGQRLAYIKNCRIDGDYMVLASPDGYIRYRMGDFVITEGDGVCVNVPKDTLPDYKIVAIKPYRYLSLELEKIR